MNQIKTDTLKSDASLTPRLETKGSEKKYISIER